MSNFKIFVFAALVLYQVNVSFSQEKETCVSTGDSITLCQKLSTADGACILSVNQGGDSKVRVNTAVLYEASSEKFIQLYLTETGGLKVTTGTGSTLWEFSSALFSGDVKEEAAPYYMYLNHDADDCTLYIANQLGVKAKVISTTA